MMLQQPIDGLKSIPIASVLAIIIMLTCACKPYAVPVGITGMVHAANQKKIENSQREIGDVMFFEIRARVRTRAGTQEKTELVTAKIIGHKEFAGSVARVFESDYEHGGKLIFRNSQGRTLIIRSRPAGQLGTEHDGGLDHLIAGYVDGKYVHPKELRNESSLAKHGFVLESYIAPIIRR